MISMAYSILDDLGARFRVRSRLNRKRRFLAGWGWLALDDLWRWPDEDMGFVLFNHPSDFCAFESLGETPPFVQSLGEQPPAFVFIGVFADGIPFERSPNVFVLKVR